MGILNITPDSFSDGGFYYDKTAALFRAEELIKDGADIIDIGGQSTRPGSSEVSEEEEIDRIVSIIEAVSSLGIIVSADTSRAAVMRAAIQAGASIINDVYALQRPGSLEVVSKTGVAVCLMHMKGNPETMQKSPFYYNVIEEICFFFRQRIKACLNANICLENIIIDPGIGFGKTSVHNKSIINNLTDFKQLDLPILIGLSRKKFIRDILGNTGYGDLDEASALIGAKAWINGADLIRVHDVKAIKRNIHLLKNI